MKQGLEAAARTLWATLAELRPGKRGTGKSAAEILQGLKESGYKQPTIESIQKDERRVNELFKSEIRIGNISEARTRGLYAATRQIWQGRSPEGRNEALLDFFYDGSTKQAQEFREWAKEHNYSDSFRSMFVLEEYIREVNESAIARAETEGSYPYASFDLLKTYG